MLPPVPANPRAAGVVASELATAGRPVFINSRFTLPKYIVCGEECKAVVYGAFGASTASTPNACVRDMRRAVSTQAHRRDVLRITL
jgi:hypothetical protein